MTKVTRLLESVLTFVLVVYTYIYEIARCFVEKISKNFLVIFPSDCDTRYIATNQCFH